jgi:hypothetical protein
MNYLDAFLNMGQQISDRLTLHNIENTLDTREFAIAPFVHFCIQYRGRIGWIIHFIYSKYESACPIYGYTFYMQ